MLMRTLVTFILRLWVDPQADEPAWEGQVENVTAGERAHIRGPEELARFLEAQTAEAKRPDTVLKLVGSQTKEEE
jgi:hypothetical protein